MKLSRRSLIRYAASVSGGLLTKASASQYLAQSPPTSTQPIAADRTVYLFGDSPAYSPIRRIGDIGRLTASAVNVSDAYLVGGAVGELEQHMAALLGKEDAVFMPTGTLANNVAVRLLCGERRHVLVQQESHLYQDEGDSASLLSGINLVPLAEGRPCPTYEEICDSIDVAEKSPYPISVGAFSLESPVRRCDGASVPYAQAERISRLARSKGIGMHLDGARLFLLSGTDGFDLPRYTALFDTVYISLYKYFGAPFGAILAGNKALIARARETRHVYGGTIAYGWMAALAALHGMEGFQQRFAEAHRAGERLLNGLQTSGKFEVQRVENGSNIAFLRISPTLLPNLSERLAKSDIRIRKIDEGKLKIWINESILRQQTDEIVAAFTAAH